MKNTKNLLITGIALTITLFASVQVVAIEPNREVNPHLTQSQKGRLKTDLQLATALLKGCSQGALDLQDCKAFEGFFSKLEDMYYGNLTYTNEEFKNIMNNLYSKDRGPVSK